MPEQAPRASDIGRSTIKVVGAGSDVYKDVEREVLLFGARSIGS